MTRVRPFLFALLALVPLAACGGREYTAADFHSILPDLVRFADADARQNIGPKRPEGPLWIDVKSFASGSWQVTGETANHDTLFARIANPAAQRVERPQHALVIQDTGTVAASPEAMAGFAGGRWVRGYGVLLHLNLVKADSREMVVTVTSYATDRRKWPTDICRRVLRVVYRKNDAGVLRRSGSEVRKRCEDPD
ncbi:MAG TPA: hypothetical protein VEX86_25210 [Longimicrobium sp.]|nr:hypothetical protein [Longimicrobium sp.]